MFCEKCGTDNRDNATVCSRCGEKMPATSSCGGFGDILSYEEKIPSATAASSPSASVSSEKFTDELRKLKTENAFLKNKVRSLSRQTLISLGISCIAVIFAAITFFSVPGAEKKPGVNAENPTQEPKITSSSVVDIAIDQAD